MNIQILGYYGERNFGDDMFEYIFRKIFSKHKVHIANPNNLSNLQNNIDILICGGGDIIQDYFMKKIAMLKKNWEKTHGKKLPTYAISIGLSYPDQLIKDNVHYLDIFDYFIVRNKHDCELLKKRYGEKYVKYLPDITFLIPPLLKYVPNRKNKIGFFLARTICNNQQVYNKFISEISNIVANLSTVYDIDLVSCDRGITSNNNDSIINDNILSIIKHKNCDKKINIISGIGSEAICKLFYEYEFTICMRFHSVVFSYITNTPFIAIPITKKVTYFLDDNMLNNNIVDINNLSMIYNKIHTMYKLQNNIQLEYEQTDYTDAIMNKFVRDDAPFYIDDKEINSFETNLRKKLNEIIIKYKQQKSCGFCISSTIKCNDTQNCKTIDDLCIKFLGQNYKKTKKLTNLIISTISNILTGNYKSDYNWGMEKQLYTLNISESTKWILNHFYCNKSKNAKSKIMDGYGVNMKYIESFLPDNVHRAGWKYVVGDLYDSFHSDNSNIILDTCIDATFHWNFDALVYDEKIPYKKRWIGIIHHTPNEEYTKYNTTALLENNIFIESLNNCICLIVLSNFLKNWFDEKFKLLNLNVKVVCLYHPTEFTKLVFNYDNFVNNDKKMVVQIGGWLRNAYGIYALQINSKKLNITKGVLRGKMMENYFKNDDFDLENIIKDKIDSCRSILSSPSNASIQSEQEKHISHNYNIPCCSAPCCHVSNDMIGISNKYIKGMVDNVNMNYTSVNEINRLSNDEYDMLLTNNIVFLNLIEASACNTLIECIVRNTPILINKLPAVIEMLGDEYPFYYDSLAEAGQMATDLQLIKKANEYLIKMDKTKLKIEYFLSEFNKNVLSLCK
ncbi:putative WcaK-like polysaccharide pyruvyl transferase [Bodo saltans virus]|uniref:WcaK-like polysaccharide pyruvyl transferase n=1 Tax=Bodo saltans virus TaxID=2024608 RepID=A0A2H4UTU3_9VIRU|nr:putative WcaK-like polysaccharide pyruvyl transferase [Bodo saltans virus]ATZ80352.1 putative WcaK-like polysaccharide pyruvyl transferase [Bodo saltans virus]